MRGWQQLARAAGVDEGTIQRLESDLKGMAKKPAQAVCKVLDIAADPNKTGSVMIVAGLEFTSVTS
jgi:hypothetical protein